MTDSSGNSPTKQMSPFQIKTKFISSTIIETEGKHDLFVEYTFRIITLYKKWYITKRYSDFVQLDKVLKEKDLVLPPFPPKRIFKNSQSTINERKEKLTVYLSTLLQSVNIWKYQEIIDFIELDIEVLDLLIKKNMMIDSSDNDYYSMSASFNRCLSSRRTGSLERSSKSLEVGSHQFNSFGYGSNYFSSFLEYKINSRDLMKDDKTPNLMVITEFLRNLEEKKDNKSEIIKTFETFLKNMDQFPHFTDKEIRYFFSHGISSRKSKNKKGALPTSTFSTADNSKEENEVDNSSIELHGLLYHIGMNDTNTLGSESCLDLLGKLLDYEFNPEYERYIYVLREKKFENLKTMNLSQYLHTNSSNIVNTVFKIISAIMGDEDSKEFLRMIINNESIINKYEAWYEHNMIK